MLKLLLITSCDGNVKYSHYFTFFPHEKRSMLENKVISMCLNCSKDSCHFLEDLDQMIIYRWFGPVLVIATAELEENELLVYEFLNLFMCCLQRYFGKLSEKHILFNADRIHMILEEMVVDGEIVESSTKNVVSPISMLDSLSKG